MVLKLPRTSTRWNDAVFLAALSFLCFGLFLVRAFLSGSIHYIFLNWNLFLAFVPWALSTFAVINPGIQKSKAVVLFILGTWLLFFPNAPYILTDLYHLTRASSMPIWFDLVLILSFAWTGLLFGFMSLWDIEGILNKWIPERMTAVLSVFMLYLTAFGIYLGRYLRWNSWDMLTDPFAIGHDLYERVAHPFTHSNAWGMTFLLGTFLTIVYWSFRRVRFRSIADRSS